MYESIEKLINIDYNNRSIDRLYEAARNLTDKPIIEHIADEICAIPQDRCVFFATGSVTRTWVTPKIGETDGPLGTAVLAKRVCEIMSAFPVIFTEESLVGPISKVVQAAGLSVVTVEQARAAKECADMGKTSVACVLPFTDDDSKAPGEARNLISNFDPAMVICIEKAGFNEAGIYHNMRGHDYSNGRCRADYIVKEALKAKIVTIGIGDGGNEIGMGTVIDAVRKYVEYGAECQCGCGKGMAACTPTDILLTSSVSNWGCYAICAALALKCKNPKWVHNSLDERMLLDVAVQAGMVDGATGKAERTVDGFSAEANGSIVDLMKYLVMKKLGY